MDQAGFETHRDQSGHRLDPVEVRPLWYIVNYIHNGHDYKVLCPRVRGPCPFNQVLANMPDDHTHSHGEEGNRSVPTSLVDVTQSVKRYMGPSYNFHGIVTTPGMLGYESLTFVKVDLNGCGDTESGHDVNEPTTCGSSITFDRDTPIRVVGENVEWS